MKNSKKNADSPLLWPKLLLLGTIFAALLVVGLDYGFNAFDRNETADTSTSPASDLPDQTPAPESQNPSDGSTPPPSQHSKAMTVDIVGLNAHIRSYVGYEVTISIGSSLDVAGTCKITFSKPGAESIVYNKTTQPDPTKPNGYTTWCDYIKLAAMRQDDNSWQYYMEPGLWTVTAEITGNNGKVGSDIRTIEIQQL
jgi:hypothetical protein